MWKCFYFLALVPALLAAPAWAGEPDEQEIDYCAILEEADENRRGAGDFEIAHCLSQQLDAADRQLNRLYRQIMTHHIRLDEPGEGEEFAGEDRSYARRLQAAERAWIKFRDNWCEQSYPIDPMHAGTMHPVLFRDCLLKETQTHIERLFALVAPYGLEIEPEEIKESENRRKELGP